MAVEAPPARAAMGGSDILRSVRVVIQRPVSFDGFGQIESGYGYKKTTGGFMAAGFTFRSPRADVDIGRARN